MTTRGSRVRLAFTSSPASYLPHDLEPVPYALGAHFFVKWEWNKTVKRSKSTYPTKIVGIILSTRDAEQIPVGDTDYTSQHMLLAGREVAGKAGDGAYELPRVEGGCLLISCGQRGLSDKVRFEQTQEDRV